MITSILRVILSKSFKPFIFNNLGSGDFNFYSPNTGIYIHVPFCRDICPFCPYYKEKYHEKKAENFAEMLVNEINLRKPKSSLPLTSIYMGGGSPAVLIDYFPLFFAEIKKHYRIAGKIGIELSPDDVSEDNLQKLKEIGFDMVSIGIQSFQERLIENLGRKYRASPDKIKLAQQAGFGVIDVDLIFGIPGQNEQDLGKDFSVAVGNGATQVSTYPFIDFSFAKNKLKPLSQHKKKKLLKSLGKISEEFGFERTSVWTFAKKGTSRYSSITRDNYIGFGPSAVSLSLDRLTVNTFSVDEYVKRIDGGRDATALSLEFDRKLRVLYWLFWSLYNLEVNRDNFKSLFSSELEGHLRLEMKAMLLLGLLRKTPTGYRLTDRGAYCFHRIEQHYTRQYIDKMWSVCTRDPWPKSIVLY